MTRRRPTSKKKRTARVAGVAGSPTPTFEFLARRVLARAAANLYPAPPAMLRGSGAWLDRRAYAARTRLENRPALELTVDEARREQAAKTAYLARDAERLGLPVLGVKRPAHRPSKGFDADDVAELVAAALREAPEKGREAATQRAADALGVGPRQIRRYCEAAQRT
jgi:hypothetical protein